MHFLFPALCKGTAFFVCYKRVGEIFEKILKLVGFGLFGPILEVSRKYLGGRNVFLKKF